MDSRYLLAIAAVALLGVLAYALIARAPNSLALASLSPFPSQNSPLNSLFTNALSSSPDPRVLPKPTVKKTGSGSIEIVEYGDFKCGYTRKAEAEIGRVLSQHGNRVTLVFRHFPGTEQAQKAAIASECALAQGKFWEYRGLALKGDTDDAALLQYARDLGLDEARFSVCLSSSSALGAVAADYYGGASKGVRGTPTVFVNGKEIEASFNAMNAEIEKEG